MAFPATLPTVQVTTGPWLAPGSGRPLKSGIVRLQARQAVHDTASGAVVLGSAVDIVLDSDGVGSETVPAGYYWWLSFRFGFGVPTPKPKLVLLDTAPAGIDLDKLIDVPLPDGTPVAVPVVMSIAGLTGTVTLEQLRAALGLTGSALVVDNGDGTFTVADGAEGPDGSYTLTAATDNGDGTFTITT